MTWKGLVEILSLCLLFINIAYVQVEQYKIDGKLIYVKELSTNERQLTVLTAETRYSFNLSSDQFRCYHLSDDEEYIAVSSEENPHALYVYNLFNQEEVIEIPWRSQWEPCQFGWVENSHTALNITLKSERITTHGRYDILVTLNISTGEISDPYVEIYRYIPPSLPNRVPQDAYYEQSPNPDIYLYSRCISGFIETLIDGEESCDGPSEAVIYDVTQHLTIEVLSDPPQFEENYIGPFSNLIPGKTRIGWSPSGRYLAYITGTRDYTLATDLQSVNVYDMESHQYWEPLVLNYPNYGTTLYGGPGIIWSPDEQKFAFWLIPPDENNNVQDSFSTDRVLVIFDREIGILDMIDEIYQLRFCDLRWSPDSQTIAFISGNDSSLMLLDTKNKNTVILDKNVLYVRGEWSDS